LTVVPPIPGSKLTSGLLYRRIPNTDQWDYSRQRPTKFAFRPDKDELGRLEDSVSMFLASRATPEQVLQDHGDYGLCAIDIGRMLAVARDKREVVRVVFMPNTDGPAGHAHCDVEGLAGPMQKALARSIAEVVRPAGRPVEGVPSRAEDEDPRR